MSWIETRNGRHRGCYRDAAGKKHYTGWSTRKRDVKQEAEEQEARLRNGTWVDPTAGKMTFARYFEEEWLPNRILEETTKAGYLSHYHSTLKPEFGDMEIRKITGPVVQRWVTRMQRDGANPNTIRKKFMTLQVVLAGERGVSARRDQLISINPCQGVTLPEVDPREVDVYTVEESDQIIAALDAWWRALVALAAETGMRWGELMGLRVSSFSVGFRKVTVNETIIELTKAQAGTGSRFKWKARPKSRKPRTFALSEEAAEMVATLVRERHLFPADRLFSMPGKNGEPKRTEEWPEGLPISRHFFRESVWRRAHLATGVKRRRFHDLRGSHISWLLAGGTDVTSVMVRVGHTQLATTQKYVDALPDADERALEGLARTRQRARERSAQ